MSRPPISSRPLFRRKRGASLTGYGLIVGLIAIIALISIQKVGHKRQSTF